MNHSNQAVEPNVPALDTDPASRDRDMSWLDFNDRVLHESLDDRNPLLERVKFLAIFTSNLDEFFMKRIGLLRRRIRKSSKRGSIKSQEKMTYVRNKTNQMLTTEAECFANELLPALNENGIFLKDWQTLTDAQREEARNFFIKNVSPALIPLALDPGHPFPYLSNLSTSVGFVLRRPDSQESSFARVKVPNIFPQWIRLEADSDPDTHCFVALHELIRHNADLLFPGLEIIDSTLFRITRNAEIESDEDVDDIREMVEEELRQRRFEPVVRLQLEQNPNQWVKGILTRQFELTDDDVYETPGQLDYAGLLTIVNLGIKRLSDHPWNPIVPKSLADEETNLFDVIRAGDFLVHHPYESFDASVEHFIRAASTDPKVVAIKMTVYRVGDDTPFVRSLIRAAESGKQVACLIELKARFDEERKSLLGATTGENRCACCLRCDGPQDAHQSCHGSAAGNQWLAGIRSHRHR